MSITPDAAPFRPAYSRDSAGLYYRIGGGGGAVYVGPLLDAPSPTAYSQWVVTDDPDAYALQVSDGTAWYPIAAGSGSGGGGTEPPAPVIFTTKGATFAPKLWQATDSPNEIEWVNDITSAVVGTGPTPTIDFGTAGTRTIRMHCTRPQDVLTLNVGYDVSHDTGNYLPGASGGAVTGGAAAYNHPPQRVTAVTGLQVLTNLVNFMAAGNPEDPTLGADRLTGTVNFSGLSKLEFIECAYALISGTDLTGCTSLIRLCFEQNNWQGNTLDLNPVRANLRDLRMAFQGGVSFVPLTGPLAHLYHLCVREQPITNMPQQVNLPECSEHWTWGNGQTGTFIAPPATADARIYSNSYTGLDFTNTTSTNSPGQFIAANNNLGSNITGLATMRRFDQILMDNCGLPQATVDLILSTVNGWGRTGGVLNLGLNGGSYPNAAPTGGASNPDVVALRGRGWTVTIA